jgi:hypothetical protein
VQIKWSLAFVAISGVGTALAMAIPAIEDHNSPDVVGAVDKNHLVVSSASNDRFDKQQNDVRFDLASIKRTVPIKIQNSRLFQSKSWYKAQAAAAIQKVSTPLSMPSAPIEPTAPPLTFAYVGKMVDGTNVTLFLLKNGQQYTVKENDILDGVYRVDVITDSNANLTYLPMNISQKLMFESTSIGNIASATQIPSPVPTNTVNSTQLTQPIGITINQLTPKL